MGGDEYSIVQTPLLCFDALTFLAFGNFGATPEIKINYPMTHPFVHNRNLCVMISVESEMVTMQYTFCLRFVKLNRKIVFSWFDPLLIMC